MKREGGEEREIENKKKENREDVLYWFLYILISIIIQKVCTRLKRVTKRGRKESKLPEREGKTRDENRTKGREGKEKEWYPL